MTDLQIQSAAGGLIRAAAADGSQSLAGSNSAQALLDLASALPGSTSATAATSLADVLRTDAQKTAAELDHFGLTAGLTHDTLLTVDQGSATLAGTTTVQLNAVPWGAR